MPEAPSEPASSISPAEPMPKPVDALGPPPTPRRHAEPRKTRRWLIGLEGVAMQLPTLRPRVLRLDRRFLGATTTLGGAGILTRFRPNPFIAVDAGIRSGSVRYRNDNDDTVISQDLILFEAGVLLYLARGRITHLAIDAGGGGFYNRLRYVSQAGEGAQDYGSATIRVGLDLEILLRRIAFVASLRSYGVITPKTGSPPTGPLFADQTSELTPPVPLLQTYLIGSFGVAYRF
ncbi:MAG: hypothetical protein ACPG77_19530, partial [Nannocystaceae bacterium]